MNGKKLKGGCKNIILPIAIVAMVLIIIIVAVQELKRDANNKIQQETSSERKEQKTEVVTVSRPEPIIVTEGEIEYFCQYTDGYTAMIATDGKEVVSKNVIPNVYLESGNVGTITTESEGGTDYELIVYKLSPLFEEGNIAKIEYLLENCVGKVNGDLTYKVERDFMVKSTPYEIISDEQKDIYLNIYVKFNGSDSSYSENNRVVRKALEDARLKIKLTYDDQIEDVRYIGFEPYSEYGYRQFKLCDLTVEK